MYFQMFMLFFSGFLYATTFSPLSLEEMIHHSDDIVYGVVLEKKSFVDKNQIFTKVIIKPKKWLNPDYYDKNYEIYIPGGRVGDQVQLIHGNAKFEIGEKVLVSLKNHQERLWVANLGMGKYSEKKIGNSLVLVNQVLPENPQIGQFSTKFFFNEVEKIKKTKFLSKIKTRYDIIREKKNKLSTRKAQRSIASVNEKEEEPLSILWLVLVLAAMGAISTFVRMKRR